MTTEIARDSNVGPNKVTISTIRTGDGFETRLFDKMGDELLGTYTERAAAVAGHVSHVMAFKGKRN